MANSLVTGSRPVATGQVSSSWAEDLRDDLRGVDPCRALVRCRVVGAGITLAILVLPIVIITAVEAVRAVPSALRKGAYGVGATRSEVVRTQVLPTRSPASSRMVLALAPSARRHRFT